MSSSIVVEPSARTFAAQLGVGVMTAVTVSMPLALGVTVFDRSVIQFANGTAPSLSRALGQGFLAVLRSPLACMMGKDNLAVFCVYGGTYIAKNSAEIGSVEYGIPKFWPVFFASTLVNSSMGLLKDRYLATMFGKPRGSFPMSSYISFIFRDSVIVGASFNGPALVSPWIQKATGKSAEVCDVVAQLSCPAAAQIIGTPLHMLGLDFYNRPNKPGRSVSFSARVADAIKSSSGPIGARMARQCYVFGFGGLAVKYANKIAGNQ